MSKELWLVRDEAWVVFDAKEIKDLMECPKSDYEKKYIMSDADYAAYTAARDEWYKWQRRLAFVLDN